MAIQVRSGATLQCTFGLAPGSLVVLPINRVNTEIPDANIMDYAPLVNIMPFGACISIANPTVAAATAAAWGVLTPMPCIPNIPGPWTPGSPTVMLGGQPTLNNSCMLTCMWGGMISVINPGQETVTVA
ncbi:MAG: DUF4280 domain-containing protein [Bryobacteraceae bacterium]